MASVNRVTTTTGASHSFADEEKESFVDHINNSLGHDDDLARHLPINPQDMSLFEKTADGILLWFVLYLRIPSSSSANPLPIPLFISPPRVPFIRFFSFFPLFFLSFPNPKTNKKKRFCTLLTNYLSPPLFH